MVDAAAGRASMPAPTRLPPGLALLFLDALALVPGVRRLAQAGHVIVRNEGKLPYSTQATRPIAVVSGRPVPFFEDRFWSQTLINLMAYFNLSAPVKITATCIDKRVQWS